MLFRGALIGCLLVVSMTRSVFPVGGVGLHYGIDLSLSMDETVGNGERLEFDGFSDLSFQSPYPVLDSISLPVFVTRTKLERTFLNFGGKAFIDIVPVIDAVELSVNFGVWEYTGAVRYPTGLNDSYLQSRSSADEIDVDSAFNYDSKPLTLSEFSDLDYFGLKETPYAKLNLDLTLRKTFIALPPGVKMLKFYGGGGVSAHFATPVLSAPLVQEVLEEELNKSFQNIGEIAGSVFSQEEVMEGILKKIIEGLTEPTVGMHIVVGAGLKFPVIPLGFYIDAKFMIPFDDLDEHVDLGGMGVLVNGGISLSF